MIRSLPALVLVAALAGLAGPGCTTTANANLAADEPLKPVEEVDLERYAGRWYEIARYPNRWQDDKVGVVARYTLLEGGDRIRLRNTGYEEKLGGERTSGSAKGWVKSRSKGARWSVQFIWPFKADYWIIDLDEEDYMWAVVGQPSRDNLWILSRTPTLDESIMKGIRERLKEQGYDPSKLEKTPQPADGPTFKPGGGIMKSEPAEDETTSGEDDASGDGDGKNKENGGG